MGADPIDVALNSLFQFNARFVASRTNFGDVARQVPHLAGAKFAYPVDAAPLTPGVRYRLQVISAVRPPETAWFEVVDPARAQAIRQDLAELAAAAGPVVSPDTLVATRVAYLTSQGLVADARLTLMAALANQPDDVTFHVLLGDLYQRLGLSEQAADSFSEARSLGAGRAQR